MARKWFTEANTSGLNKADLLVLNRAGRSAFRAGYQPAQRELDLLKITYHRAARTISWRRSTTR